ncbi:MAG: hypothetical protein NTU95_03525 [Methanothrix sp.]|nr:hypothetical protein [Methanothrix sp.]
MSFSEGRFRGTFAGAESFLQIDRSPIGIICLARTYIRPGDSWLIYALPQSIFRYIRVQSHPAWKRDIRVTAGMWASFCICARKGAGMPHNQVNKAPLQAESNASLEGGELVHAPAGLLHAFGGARSIAADRRMHSSSIQPAIVASSAAAGLGPVSSGSHDPRLSVVRVPHSTRQDPEHHHDRITSIPNRASLGNDGIYTQQELDRCAPVSTIPPERGRSSIHPPSDNSRQIPDLSIIKPAKAALSAAAGQGPISSGSHDQRLSAVREPHPTRQDPEHPVDRIASIPNRASLGNDGISSSMHLQLGSSTRFIQFRSFSRRQSDMLTADIARRADMGGISIRAPRDLKALEAEGKVMERANISSRADFPKLVLSKTPEMNQSGSFSEPVSARGLVYPFMAQVVRQQPPEASSHTWHGPSFSGERVQDLAEASRGVDLNRLAERVYTIIERRTKIEMERRGLYSRS